MTTGKVAAIAKSMLGSGVSSAVADYLDEHPDIFTDYAKVDGSYSSLTAGNAEQLVSTVGVNDKTPYLFRTTGGSADVGDRVKLSEITGGTVAWNQILSGDISTTHAQISDYGGTGAESGGVHTLTLSGTPAYSWSARTQFGVPYTKMIAGHKYCLIAVVKASRSGKVRVYLGQGTQPDTDHSLTADTFATIGNISSCSTENLGSPSVSCGSDNASWSANDTITLKSFAVFDLTAMFGSTIADYIYSLEQNTAGAGVAWFRKLFPKDYYAYDAGSLLSVKTTAHKEVGFNAWDEVAEAKILNSDGSASGSSNRILTSYVRVLPNTTYSVTIPYNGRGRGAFYDSNKNLISYYPDFPAGNSAVFPNNGVISSVNGNYQFLFATPENACYLRYNTTTVYGNTYGNDICINLHWDGERDGEYEPYELHTYALDDVELRGIPKLDASNNLYYDGDGYAPDGTVTRKYGIVTFDGSNDEQWGVWSASVWNLRKIYLSDMATKGANRCRCNKYEYVGNISYNTDVGNMQLGTQSAQTILAFRNESIGTGADDAVSSWRTYLASNPITVIYELATPTTESADPYQETQICNDFGTEEFVDERTLKMPVCANALYQANLRAKLEMAPDSPDGDGDYIVRQTDGLNEYVAVSSNSTISGLSTRCPACPTDTDGTFVLKATVSSGAVTYAWTAE